MLFLCLWLAYGLAINSGNLEAFGLQQAGVEAYVERHHLYLEGSKVERLQVEPVVDAFLYNGHIYPAKQPGQFMAGAMVYFPLHWAGLNYSNQYLLTAALVTFFTASFATALSAFAVFRVVLRLQKSRELFWPITATLVYAFATTAFPYSGIAWHDSIATAYLVIAFCLIIEIRCGTANERQQRILTTAAGLFLGLTVTTSMLPFFMTVVLAVYFVVLRRDKLLLFFAGGGLVGLSPLLIYNWLCFGNPFLLPNVAGSYRDTFLHLNATNFLEKLYFYVKMLTIYVPIFWGGILGLALFPRRLRHEQLLILCLLIASAIYILNIDATGTCQYGPRYLLPAMPFACVGLVAFRFQPGRLRWVVLPLVLMCAGVSFAINLVGAMHGAMLCDFPHLAFSLYLSQMLSGHMRSFPLAVWLLLPFLLSAALFSAALLRVEKVIQQR